MHSQQVVSDVAQFESLILRPTCSPQVNNRPLLVFFLTQKINKHVESDGILMSHFNNEDGHLELILRFE